MTGIELLALLKRSTNHDLRCMYIMKYVAMTLRRDPNLEGD